MKKVIGQKLVDEEAYFCDNCDKEIPYLIADAEINFDFGYGSVYDGDKGDTCFCTACSKQVLEVLQQNFPKVKFIEYAPYIL